MSLPADRNDLDSAPPKDVPGESESLLDCFTDAGKAAVIAMGKLLKLNEAPAWQSQAWQLYELELHRPAHSLHTRRFILKDQMVGIIEASVIRLGAAIQGTRGSFVDDLHSLLALLPERQRRFLSARWGLLEGPVPTLESLGASEGITRERVRQIVAKAEEHLMASWPPLAMVALTEAALGQCGQVVTTSELLRVLPPGARPANASALRVLGLIAPLFGGINLTKKDGIWIVGDFDGRLAIPHEIRTVRRMVMRDLTKWGAVEQSHCTDISADGLDIAELTLERYGGCIAIDGWLVPRSCINSTLRRSVERIGGVASQLSLLRVHKQLRRKLRSIPSVAVLRVLLEHQLHRSIDDNDIVTLGNAYEGALRPGSAEALAADLLRASDGAMTFVDVERAFIAHGFSAAMANMLASRSVIIERLGPNVLGLVGIAVPSERIRALRRAAISQSAIKPLGFRNGPGPVLHLMYRVQNDLLGTAMFRFPLGRLAPGRYQVAGDARAVVIVKPNYLISPNRLLRHLLRDAMSTVTFTFDTAARTVSITVR